MLFSECFESYAGAGGRAQPSVPTDPGQGHASEQSESVQESGSSREPYKSVMGSLTYRQGKVRTAHILSAIQNIGSPFTSADQLHPSFARMNE